MRKDGGSGFSTTGIPRRRLTSSIFLFALYVLVVVYAKVETMALRSFFNLESLGQELEDEGLLAEGANIKDREEGGETDTPSCFNKTRVPHIGITMHQLL